MSEESLKAAIAKVNALVGKPKDDGGITREQADRKIELLNLEEELNAENAKLSGVGVRWFAAMTRGKGSQVIKYQGFDTSKPDTCPTDPKQFADITGVNKSKELTDLLIIGYNDQQYTDASDPIAEYVNPEWPTDVKLQFRTVVRNLAKMQEISIDEAVVMVKPGTEKKFLASQSK